MTRIRQFIFAATAFLGFSIPFTAPAQKEFIMPRMQQNTYLSHAKPPEYFGFRTLPFENGVVLHDAAARLHPNQSTTIQLSTEQIPVIGIRGHARRINSYALLDTSSPTSWMEFGTSQKFEAVFLGSEQRAIPYRGEFNLGDAAAYAAVISNIRIGDIQIENTPLFVRMAMHSLGPLARGITSPDIETVLGYDVLKQFEYFQFNSNNQSLTLSSTQPYKPDEELLMTEVRIVDITGHGLAVEGGMLGNPMPIVLDFAGAYHFSRGDIKVKLTRQVSLGDVVFRKVPTLLLPTYDGPPRAGRKLLEKYTITVCPKKGVVYFERFPE